MSGASWFPPSAGRLFVISSPSGGGKTTVVRELMRRVPKLVRSVSVTTRPRRPEERAGVDYRFISEAAFHAMQSEDRLLEWAQVHQAHYGTPRAPVERRLASGQDMILSLDVQGARQVQDRFGDRAVLVFLLPPSMDDLRRRLIRRRTDSEASIRTRMRAAERELACVEWYDYGVVNRHLERAVGQLEAIIVAERLKVRTAKRGDA